MQTYEYLWSHLAEFFLERKIFQTDLQRGSKHTVYD